MPSEDTFHRDHPETNSWIHEGQASTSSVQAKLSAILLAGKRPATSRIVMSALIQRLARSLGVSSEELASTIDDDTIRRTKYAVRERQMLDGTTLFEHPEGIMEGVISDVRK